MIASNRGSSTLSSSLHRADLRCGAFSLSSPNRFVSVNLCLGNLFAPDMFHTHTHTAHSINDAASRDACLLDQINYPVFDRHLSFDERAGGRRFPAALPETPAGSDREGRLKKSGSRARVSVLPMREKEKGESSIGRAHTRANEREHASVINHDGTTNGEKRGKEKASARAFLFVN